jgi:hypothetical protein
MNNYFCVLPFFSYENDSASSQNKHCCWLPKGTDIATVRDSIKNQQRAPVCVKCWQLEDQGQQSRRMLENSFLDYKLDQDIEKIQNNCLNQLTEPLVYQIDLGSLCNQACVSCSSFFSTRWAEIDKKMGIVPKRQFKLDLNNININYKHARRISLLGGEPLFDPLTFEILNQLQQAKNTDCFISFVTNGSIHLNADQCQLLESFTDLNFCISVDGVGPVFEYLRWPGKWNKLLENIEQYKKITPNISVSYTISSLNALYYSQTIDWFNHNNLRYNHNVVTFPDWLSLKSMPVVLKQHLRDLPFIGDYCEINGQEISATDYLKQLQLQDSAKNISCQDFLPDFLNLLTDIN